MSWVERVKKDLVITTGDGKEYRPLWVDARRNKDFNFTEFEYPEQGGAFVKRKNQKAARYEISIYFQGEDNIEQGEAFWQSANDSRPWEISHPLYDNLLVQPTNLNYDDTSFNTTRITSLVIETNLQEGPESVENVQTTITSRQESMNQASAESFASQVQPDAENITKMDQKNQALQDSAEGSFPSTEAASEFTNAVAEASRAIESAGTGPLQAMTTIQNVIRAPARFEDTVQNRLEILQRQFDELRTGLTSSSRPSEKKLYESQQSANIAAQCETSVTPLEGDYVTREDVVTVNDTILSNFNTFLDDLVNLQTDRGGKPNSYIPDPETQRQLMGLVDLSTSNLFRMIFELKREKTFETNQETNVFVLTHKLYGLDENDQNIKQLIDQNNFSLEEYFVIPQGKQIRYYA